MPRSASHLPHHTPPPHHSTPRTLPAGNRDKRLAALDIVNVSIKIYFRLNTLRLCKNLMRTVDSRQFAAFDAFPAAQRVTYRFYVGRLAAEKKVESLHPLLASQPRNVRLARVGDGPEAEKWKDAMVRGVPLRRIGEPEDYAGMVALLASDDGAYITGQAISISGGLTML